MCRGGVAGHTGSVFSGFRWVVVAALVTASLAVVGCSPPNRQLQADKIRAGVEHKPGVRSVDVSYINDFENGANVRITVEMNHAPTDQIIDVAAEIETLKGTDFTDHRQSVSISVADAAELIRGAEIEPERMAGDVDTLRRLRAQNRDGYIKWTRDASRSRLGVWASRSPDTLVRSAVSLLSPGDELYVRSESPARQSSWEVALPLTTEQYDGLRQVRDRVPLTVYELTVREARITSVSVDLGTPSDAHQHAIALLTALRPSRATPVDVEWRLGSGGQIDEFTACAELPAADNSLQNFEGLRGYFAAEALKCSG